MRKTYHQRLAAESLEDRNLLAGDVVAEVVGDTLLIRGDAESNGVAIRSAGEPGSYRISGLDVGGSPTTINGVFDAAVVSGVHRGIFAALHEGNDLFQLTDFDTRGGASIRMGAGDDRVSIGGMPRSGDDGDQPNSRIGRGVSVMLGEGNDSLRIGNAAIGQMTRISGGDGNDEVDIARSRLGRFAFVATGLGEDTVRVGGSRADHLLVRTGLGGDEATIVDSAFARLGVDLGAGDDGLNLFGNEARSALFYGGLGTDAIARGGNTFENVRAAGFEPAGNGDEREIDRWDLDPTLPTQTVFETELV